MSDIIGHIANNGYDMAIAYVAMLIDGVMIVVADMMQRPVTRPP